MSVNMSQRQLHKYPKILSKSEVAKAKSAHFLAHPLPPPPEVNQLPIPRIDLYPSIKPIIFLGRLTLIIPCSRSNASSYKRPSLSLKMIPYLASTLFLIVTCLQFVSDINFTLKRNESGPTRFTNYLINFTLILDTVMVSIIYFNFLLHSDKFYRIFDKWAEYSFHTELAKDPWLSPLAYFLILFATALSLLSQGLVVADVLTMAKVQMGNGSKSESNPRLGGSPLESAYKHFRYDDFIPYNPALAIIITACKIIHHPSVTYVSLLVVFFSRALAFQFKMLIEDATGVGVEEAHFADLKLKDGEFWRNIVAKYRFLTMLIKTINSFLSPLIFYWMCWNVYVLSIQLYRGLASGSEEVPINPQTFTIGFMIHTSRFLVSIISAAKVNTYARKILLVLRNCPKEYYHETEVHRLEQQVSTGHNVGFTGMGCFALTKPFLLKVFNALFTMEIMLLQFTHTKAN